MTACRPALVIALATLGLGLTGCAGMEDPANARSTCHTSAGEYVNVPTGCSISWSSSTTTTTTTTTTNAPAKPEED